MPGIRPILSTLAAVTLFATGSHAADHQHCFKITDPAAKASYTVDLLPSDLAFADAIGCVVQVPAKMLCIDVDKTNVVPAPPGADPGQPAQKSLCYKLKCLKTAPTVAVEDQFGSRSVTIKGSKLLCAPIPAQPGGCAIDGDCDPIANAQSVCMAGSCTMGSCTAGYGNCNGVPADGCEVSLTNDASNCGTCGTTCSAPNSTPSCTAGACSLGSCDVDYGNCNGLVVDGCEVSLTSDASNCGSCGTTCAAPNGTPSCTAGNCSVGSCNVGYGDCNSLVFDGCEVDLTNDPGNCGACGLSCPGGFTCSTGSCVPI